MPGRKYSTGSYRYGFNGKENDNEVKGEGNQQDYGLRIYDPRLGKFLSIDPIAADYPELTPYQFASNRPIDGIDIDGLEIGLVHFLNAHKNGTTRLNTSTSGNRLYVTTTRTNNCHGKGNPNFAAVGRNSNGNSTRGLSDYYWAAIKKINQSLGLNEIRRNTQKGGIQGVSENARGQNGPISETPAETVDWGPLLSAIGRYFPEIKELKKLKDIYTKAKKYLEEKRKEKEEVSSPPDQVSSTTSTSQSAPKVDFSEKKSDDTETEHNSKKTFVYERNDSFVGEKKGSIQDHMYITDSVLKLKKGTNSAPDTFLIQQRKNQ